jgi:hypothetical protein
MKDKGGHRSAALIKDSKINLRHITAVHQDRSVKLTLKSSKKKHRFSGETAKDDEGQGRACNKTTQLCDRRHEGGIKRDSLVKRYVGGMLALTFRQ